MRHDSTCQIREDFSIIPNTVEICWLYGDPRKAGYRKCDEKNKIYSIGFLKSNEHIPAVILIQHTHQNSKKSEIADKFAPKKSLQKRYKKLI